MLGAQADDVHWLANCYPIKDEEGNVARIAVVVVETAQAKEIWNDHSGGEQSCRKEMDRMQLLLDVSKTVALNWDVHQGFPQISSRIRRVLHRSIPGFELHDPNTGLLVRQVRGFPPGQRSSCRPCISVPTTSPRGHHLQEGARCPDFHQRRTAGDLEPSAERTSCKRACAGCLRADPPAGGRGGSAGTGRRSRRCLSSRRPASAQSGGRSVAGHGS